MKKSGITILIVIVAVVVLVGGFFMSTYNGLVEMQTNIEAQQAEIQNQLQRQADLIPNLVATVKDYADFEQSTLQALTEARSAIAAADTPEEQAAASDQLGQAIVNVRAVAEAYPDLKANTQYTALMDELSGTQNRITTARRDYNQAVKSYNTSIRKFPKSLLAGMFGFEKADFFEAADEAQDTPDVGELLG